MFQSIEKYKKLCSTRTHADYWHRNLIDAEKLCQTEQESKHFMNFIHNPDEYSYEKVESKEYRTLGDIIDSNEVKQIKQLPSNMETKYYKNGNEITVVNKMRDMTINEVDDEKYEE
jgi:hypothetical protein